MVGTSDGRARGCTVQVRFGYPWKERERGRVEGRGPGLHNNSVWIRKREREEGEERWPKAETAKSEDQF